tara:strand:- start:30 stop:344 length:315 start_codon:yes stop_codon:yes gene_type:complete
MTTAKEEVLKLIADKPEPEDKEILVQFSGWCRLYPSKVKFVFIGDDADEAYFEYHEIDGNQWLKLDEETRDQYYILADAAQTVKDSDVLEWVELDVIEQQWHGG